MLINLKLKKTANRMHAEREITLLYGVNSAVRMFPDENDGELVNIYLLDINQSLVSLETLQSLPYVVRAEFAAPRKLIV